MNSITANDLKTKGISLVDKNAQNGLETIVTVRGEEKYVIITTESYEKYREYELLAAIEESRRDIKNGKIHNDSIKDHIKRIKNA